MDIQISLRTLEVIIKNNILQLFFNDFQEHEIFFKKKKGILNEMIANEITHCPCFCIMIVHLQIERPAARDCIGIAY